MEMDQTMYELWEKKYMEDLEKSLKTNNLGCNIDEVIDNHASKLSAMKEEREEFHDLMKKVDFWDSNTEAELEKLRMQSARFKKHWGNETPEMVTAFYRLGLPTSDILTFAELFFKRHKK